jgi:hypothetical protein
MTWYSDQPLPEIFFERTLHREAPIRPIATPTCSKVLIVGGEAEGLRSGSGASGALRHPKFCLLRRSDGARIPHPPGAVVVEGGMA